jgi:hypothetical protein
MFFAVAFPTAGWLHRQVQVPRVSVRVPRLFIWFVTMRLIVAKIRVEPLSAMPARGADSHMPWLDLTY